MSQDDFAPAVGQGSRDPHSTYFESRLRFGFRIRKSPYFEASRRAGCTHYSVYNHMYYPVQYDDPLESDQRLVESVTLWDVAVERQVQITGPDASRFVEVLTMAGDALLDALDSGLRRLMAGQTRSLDP